MLFFVLPIRRTATTSVQTRRIVRPRQNPYKSLFYPLGEAHAIYSMPKTSKYSLRSFWFETICCWQIQTNNTVPVLKWHEISPLFLLILSDLNWFCLISHFRSAASNFMTSCKPVSRGQQEYTPRVRVCYEMFVSLIICVFLLIICFVSNVCDFVEVCVCVLLMTCVSLILVVYFC